jgi:hypothetical protein
MKPSLLRTVMWSVLVGAIGLFVAGCYTVLVHPEVDNTAADNSTRMCSDCHSSADYYYWHSPYENSWYSHSRYWNSYYYDPWWYDDYWYWHGGDRGDRGGGGTAGPERKLWQPRVPPSGQPNIAPGASGNSGNENKSSESGSGSSGGQENQSQDKKTLWQPRTPPGGSEGKQPEKPAEKPPEKPPDQKTEDQK